MNDTATGEGGDPQQQRDEAVVRLLRILFHDHFCPAEKIEQAQKGLVSPVYFFGWLDKNIGLLDQEEVCKRAKVDYEVWAFLREVLDSGTAIERLHQTWYAVVLADRPQPKHNLDKINLTMLMTWDDGTIMPIQVFVSREMMEGPGFTDGMIASIISKNMPTFVNSIVTDGLDGLHDKGDNYRGSSPEDPFEVVMGLMLKHLIPQLRQDVQKCATDYMRLFQGMVRPVLPPEVRAAIEQRKRNWQQKGRASGGWDA